jgi:MFS family permease
VPVADRSTLAITAFLIASSAGRAGLNTFSYLLAGSGAASAGAGRGAVIGLVNLSWGVAAVIGPLAASAAHGSIDERLPFAVIAVLCLAVAALLLSGHRPVRVRTRRLVRRRLALRA